MPIWLYFFVIYFCGIWAFSPSRKHLLITLLRLEFVVLVLYFSIYFSAVSKLKQLRNRRKMRIFLLGVTVHRTVDFSLCHIRVYRYGENHRGFLECNVIHSAIFHHWPSAAHNRQICHKQCALCFNSVHQGLKVRRTCTRSTLTHTEWGSVAWDNLITLQPETKQITPFVY